MPLSPFGHSDCWIRADCEPAANDPRDGPPTDPHRARAPRGPCPRLGALAEEGCAAPPGGDRGGCAPGGAPSDGAEPSSSGRSTGTAVLVGLVPLSRQGGELRSLTPTTILRPSACWPRTTERLHSLATGLLERAPRRLHPHRSYPRKIRPSPRWVSASRSAGRPVLTRVLERCPYIPLQERGPISSRHAGHQFVRELRRRRRRLHARGAARERGPGRNGATSSGSSRKDSRSRPRDGRGTGARRSPPRPRHGASTPRSQNGSRLAARYGSHFSGSTDVRTRSISRWSKGTGTGSSRPGMTKGSDPIRRECSSVPR
jgi:hypothetical protein